MLGAEPHLAQFEGRDVWSAENITKQDWLLPVPERVSLELERAADFWVESPLPHFADDMSRFEFEATKDFFRKVVHGLNFGIGFAVLDGLSFGEDARSDFKMWALSKAIGRQVATKWNGTMFYRVEDNKPPLEHGTRLSKTNQELSFHTDNPFGTTPPELVALMCVRNANKGGVSRVWSLKHIHNQMCRHHRSELRALLSGFLRSPVRTRT
ncbi:MAG: TauD/TfdA family dioxygenase [Caulobacteraceae bacterium]|nr:TauD/TfdA family dioxygenase [Caulobacteraceae bacterium]